MLYRTLTRGSDLYKAGSYILYGYHTFVLRVSADGLLTLIAFKSMLLGGAQSFCVW